jgi:hypothetical protein
MSRWSILLSPRAITQRTRVADDTAEAAGAPAPAASVGAAGRAKREIARARDVRFVATDAVIAGRIIGSGAIVSKAALNEFAGGDTGFILLLASAVVAA